MPDKNLLEFIEIIRESDDYISSIYMNGGCYQFHLILSKYLGRDCYPLINKERNHVVTNFKGTSYDVMGLASGSYSRMNVDDLSLAKTWRFSKTKALTTECESCGNENYIK